MSKTINSNSCLTLDPPPPIPRTARLVARPITPLDTPMIGGQRPSAARSLDNSMDIMEGIIMGGEKGGLGEKQLTHNEWTKDPFPDDFDDSDLA